MNPVGVASPVAAEGHAGPPPAPARATAAAWSTARRRLLLDRAAWWLVRAGGLGIIAGILAILLFIVAEVVPLLSGATVETAAIVPLPAAEVRAVVGDEYRTHAALLDLAGTVRVLRLRDRRIVAEQSILPPARGDMAAPRLTAVQVPPGTELLSASTSDGRVLSARVTWRVDFDGQQRVVTPQLQPPAAVEVDPAGRPIAVYAAGLHTDGSQAIAAQLQDGRLALVRERVKENLFTGEVSREQERLETAAPGPLTHLVLDGEQRNLYGADAHGTLFWWPVGAQLPDAPQQVSAGAAAVTALSLLVGGRSLVVGQADGALSVWFTAPDADGRPRLTRIRDFPRQPGAIELIAPSRRDRSFLVQRSGGELGLYYSTSHRVLWTGKAPIGFATALAYAPKADGAYAAGDAALALLDVDNPHPDVSLWSLFGPVWYESAARPEYVWQSSSGTDDFEAKFSLTPLLAGTLKGTVYSLLIAIPLAVFGAMYLSQFMHPRLKRIVKPAVEIMAALPSVVLGFLAGLWLAPRLERAFPALLVLMALFPLLTLSAGALWQAVPQRMRGRVPAGSEVVLFLGVFAGGLWLSLALSRPLEAAVFDGSFPSWLLRTTGLPYDQRNAVVVGLAMGFAVIPIIFAIAEDAFTNVPRDLVSGSLALGANRWQTVTRIVLPTASPGIFSAVMVGFGRAVGETMIVLMATGNTPILDWNPFNGFRTLSANIAVEIPEAPQFGTLYRVLFLAALLLFAVTFAVNTAAELVRQRLRRRYAQL